MARTRKAQLADSILNSAESQLENAGIGPWGNEDVERSEDWHAATKAVYAYVDKYLEENEHAKH